MLWGWYWIICTLRVAGTLSDNMVNNPWIFWVNEWVKAGMSNIHKVCYCRLSAFVSLKRFALTSRQRRLLSMGFLSNLHSYILQGLQENSVAWSWKKMHKWVELGPHLQTQALHSDLQTPTLLSVWVAAQTEVGQWHVVKPLVDNRKSTILIFNLASELAFSSSVQFSLAAFVSGLFTISELAEAWWRLTVASLCRFLCSPWLGSFSSVSWVNLSECIRGTRKAKTETA